MKAVVTCVPGELFRYTIQFPGKPEYLVDLCDEYPLGGCSCRSYECVKLPAFRRTGDPVRCKHLVECREQVFNSVLRQHKS